MTLANLPERLQTHGDIVVDVQPTFVETIGGNLHVAHGPDTTVRSARARANADTRATHRVSSSSIHRNSSSQEDDTGALAALPLTSTEALHKHSTRRIFAVLSLVEECRAPRQLPYPAGSLA